MYLKDTFLKYLAQHCYQLRTANSAITSVCVADVELLVANDVMLDRSLTFDKHILAVTWSCNFHAQAIRHIRHLFLTDLAQTLACSLIQTRLDYCNSVLYGAPSAASRSCSVCRTMQPESDQSTTAPLQRVMNAAFATRLQPPVKGPCHTSFEGAALVADSSSSAV